MTGIATVSESKNNHFTVLIAGILIQSYKHIGLKRVDEDDGRPALMLHLLEQNLLEPELFPMCWPSEKILSGHSLLLTRCQSMQTKDGIECTIRHIPSLDV